MFAGSLFLSLTHVLDVEVTRYLDPLSQRPHRLGPAGTNPTRIPVVHGDCWTGPPISLAGSTGPNLQPPPRLPKASTSRASRICNFTESDCVSAAGVHFSMVPR